MSREGCCRNARGIFLNKVPGEFCGGIFGWNFSGLFPWRKTGGKNPPKNPPGNVQIRIWEFRGQNPHCKDPALKKWPNYRTPARIRNRGEPSGMTFRHRSLRGQNINSHSRGRALRKGVFLPSKHLLQHHPLL